MPLIPVDKMGDDMDVNDWQEQADEVLKMRTPNPNVAARLHQILLEKANGGDPHFNPLVTLYEADLEKASKGGIDPTKLS